MISLTSKSKEKKFHPVMDLADKFRKVLLDLGFEEMINPSIVSEEDVYKQYGSEAPLILDRSFYLAGLLRVDLGISEEMMTEIKKIGDINIAELQKIFREFKEAKIEADNLIEEMVKQLKIKTEQAIEILTLFPGLKDLKPVPTKFVLRSHMTAAWYLTISALIQKNYTSLKLFSIGPKFRREQRQDALHLYESLSASLAIADKKIGLKEGKKLVNKILSKIGFKKAIFKTKPATSNYYALGTEFEVFIEQNNKVVEIGDGGMYSSDSLANYNIPYPVFNVGFGIERIAMIMRNIDDIRLLTYPQFYAKAFFDDKDIAAGIEFKERPTTKWGKDFTRTIMATILKHKDEIGPQKILIKKDQDIKLFLSEPEANKKLLGPAGLNVVYVYDGNILGINEKDEKFSEVIKKGIKVYSYIEALSNLFASLAENKNFGKHTVKMADTLPSINLNLKKEVEQFIVGQQKKIDVRGPVFIDFEIEKISKL